MEHLSVPSLERTRSGYSFWGPSAYLRERQLCRGVLVILSVMIIVGMIIGLIFVAHYYFHMWGGQGFLRARNSVQLSRGDNMPFVCLPLRPMAHPAGDIHGFDYSGVKQSHSSVPFYPCGDQQNGCEAFHGANICCPVGMSCHSTPYTDSGVFCCNSTIPDSECKASPSLPPQCPPASFECAAVVGGGCCPNGTTCSQNGCIEFDGSGTPPPITITYITYTTASSAQRAGISTDFIATTITTIVTIVIGGATTPTATVHKQGPDAQRAEGASVLQIGWHILVDLPFSPLMVFGVVALGTILL